MVVSLRASGCPHFISSHPPQSQKRNELSDESKESQPVKSVSLLIMARSILANPSRDMAVNRCVDREWMRPPPRFICGLKINYHSVLIHKESGSVLSIGLRQCRQCPVLMSGGSMVAALPGSLQSHLCN